MEYGVHAYLVRNKHVNFERELWFQLGKFMLKKHRNVYQDHLKYIHHDIVKPFRVKIHRYAKFLPPPSIKSMSREEANWTVRNQ